MKSQWTKRWQPKSELDKVGLELPRDVGTDRGSSFDGNLTAGPNGPSAGPNRRDAMLAAHLARNRGRGPLGERRDPLFDPILRDGLKRHGLTPAWKQRHKGVV